MVFKALGNLTLAVLTVALIVLGVHLTLLP